MQAATNCHAAALTLVKAALCRIDNLQASANLAASAQPQA